jgi:16S rRNA (cytosine1402-N4)-methyltransferase
MLDPVVDLLARRGDGVLVDATVGLGGHAEALLDRCPAATLVGLDVDPEALAVAGTRLARFGDRARLVRASYHDLPAVLHAHGFDAVEAVLFDLGVSSLQLDSPTRGFSFRFEGPLDMRFSGEGMTAAELLARVTEEELRRILEEHGEEPRARRVARAIVAARLREPLRTTTDLVRVVSRALGGRRGKIDPATRTFQALRIATNRELAGLPAAVEQAARLLSPCGRLAVIAFHSLEDRLVKRTLRRLSGRCVCPPGTPICSCEPESLLDILTRRPLRPSDDEVRTNPRARSARLRAAERRRA